MTHPGINMYKPWCDGCDRSSDRSYNRSAIGTLTGDAYWQAAVAGVPSSIVTHPHYSFRDEYTSHMY